MNVGTTRTESCEEPAPTRRLSRLMHSSVHPLIHSSLTLPFLSPADVLIAALTREFHLALPFAQPGLLCHRLLIVATRTTHAFDEELRCLLGFADRLTAGAAQVVLAGLQAVTDRDALIEHETLALPATLF